MPTYNDATGTYDAAVWTYNGDSAVGAMSTGTAAPTATMEPQSSAPTSSMSVSTT
jgi:hypothetical protein